MLWVTMSMAWVGKSGAAQSLEQLGAEVLGGQHVKGGEGLVHQQGVRLHHERPGESDALPHPAGELLGIGGLEAVEPDPVDFLGRSSRHSAGGMPLACSPTSTFFSTVSQGSRAKLWKTMATPGLAPVTGLPR